MNTPSHAIVFIPKHKLFFKYLYEVNIQQKKNKKLCSAEYYV